MLGELETALADAGQSLRKANSFLEFACGYGRFTRFLVSVLDPTKVTVSDIDQRAVNFVKATFGVSGFYSVTQPKRLECVTTYQIVFVASLFSHLPLEPWRNWALRLFNLTAPGGAFVFSTHGMHSFDQLSPTSKEQNTSVADGMWFCANNETKGRLSGSEYGTTYVTEDFVRRFFLENSKAEVARFIPRGLWNHQDLYVVRTSLE